MLYKKTPKIENISKYKSYKVLSYLVKPKSILSIKFFTNDPDEWTIDKVCYKTKTGEITLDEGINADDLNYWIQTYLDRGYKVL